MRLGAVIVVYNSEDVIGDCLRALLSAERTPDHIIVFDNASPDNSFDLICNLLIEFGVDWDVRCANDASAPRQVSIVRSDRNLGFAGGTNAGLRILRSIDCDLYWLLNPDCIARRDTASALLACSEKNIGFGLIGGRVLFVDPKGIVHSDGGQIDRKTGVCSSINRGRSIRNAPPPPSELLDFVSGAHLVASKRFLDVVGLMDETYFLYYEEVDWALRRGNLRIVVCPSAIVEHHIGTSIGSGSFHTSATAFSNFFNFRNRRLFVRRHLPMAIAGCYAYAAAKCLQLLTRGQLSEANGAFRGAFGRLPPKEVVARIDPRSREMAFGKNAAKRL